MSAAGGRVYRLAPLDRTGWLLGLSGAQCVAIAAGIFVSGTLLENGASAPVVLGPLALALAFAFGAWDRRPLHEWTLTILRHAIRSIRGRRWAATLPLLSGTSADDAKAPSLPPFLAGLVMIDAGPVAWSPRTAQTGVAVVWDQRDRTVSASIPVVGREFALVERAEQERIVQLWGDALAGFCSERGAVSRVRVCEWAAPAGVAEHEAFAHRQTGVRGSVDAVESYRELLVDAGPMAVRHEVLVTVTVDPRRLRSARKTEGRQRNAAIDALLEEIRLFSSRLDTAGLTVEPPLGPRELARVLRLRIDPASRRRLAACEAGLAQLAGRVSPWNTGPLATELAWGHVRADGALHRTYWIAEWPRLDVPPNWLEPVLLHAGGVRGLAIHYEPVEPSRSRRQIDRDSTRLAADEEQRIRTGFRVGARHRRAQAAVIEREEELVAGYAELEYAGFVTVTAADETDLARSCAEYEQAAAQAGLELRALDGRHELGLVCTLPVGRGMAARRFA